MPRLDENWPVCLENSGPLLLQAIVSLYDTKHRAISSKQT